jgi:hypothetical protein
VTKLSPKKHDVQESFYDAGFADSSIGSIALPCIARRGEMRVCGKLNWHAFASLRLEAAVAFPLRSIEISNEDGMIRHPYGNTGLIFLLETSITPPFISRGCEIGMRRNIDLYAG